MPIWISGRAQLSMALKFDVGPMGLRVTLDPERLIAADTTAVIDYLASQLAVHYQALTFPAVKWSAVTKELSKTIDTAYTTYLNQEKQRNANKKTQKNINDTTNDSA